MIDIYTRKKLFASINDVLKPLPLLKPISLKIIKLASGLILGFIFSVFGKELIDYGIFASVFVLLSSLLAFLYLVKDLNFLGIFLTDVLIVATALLLRLYVVLAQGA